MRKQMAVKLQREEQNWHIQLKDVRTFKSHFNFSLNCANQPKSKKVSKHVEPNSINFKKPTYLLMFPSKKKQHFTSSWREWQWNTAQTNLKNSYPPASASQVLLISGICLQAQLNLLFNQWCLEMIRISISKN